MPAEVRAEVPSGRVDAPFVGASVVSTVGLIGRGRRSKGVEKAMSVSVR